MTNEDALIKLADALIGLQRLNLATSPVSGPETLVADPIEPLTRLTASLDQARATQQEQIRAVAQNTSSSNASTSANDESGFLDSLAGRILVGPVVGGILRLFGGSQAEAAPPLQVFAKPPSIRLQAGFSDRLGGETEQIDRGQDALPRTMRNHAEAQQITVDVQAIDSRSFLDHSDEIAQAVRHAFLNSHALSDVVGEL